MTDAATATITVLLTDLVESTRLLQHGAETFDDIRRAHFTAVRQAVAAHRGAEVESTGDGIMATFTSTADAVAAAVAVQQAVRRLRQREPRSPEVRVGLACGEATSEDGDWYGEPVIEAARLCAAADPGQILTDSLLPALVGSRGGHVFLSRGELALKGFDTPTAVVEVQWTPLSATAMPPAAELAAAGFFVGREDELEQLVAAWKEAAAGGRRVVLVSGEPGIGKTRLVAELARHAHEEGGTVLWGRCDEELVVAYQPFVEAFREWLAHADAARVTAVPDRPALEPILAGGDTGPELGLAAGDPEGQRLRLLDAVGGLLRTIEADAPALLVLDDIHWAATPTLLLLRHLVNDPAPSSLLIVATYRDTDLDRTRPLAGVLADLRRSPNVERLALVGVDVAAVRAFLDAVAGERLGPEADHLAAAVHAETEGNLFFVAQVLRHLIETGGLARVDGRWSLTAPIDELGIPEGVREVVGRRLSRLSDTANQVLAVSAVIGRDFELRTLEETTGLGEAVLDGVEEAVGAHLVSELAAPPGWFTFSHAIVRQTLLAELTAVRRARLHRRVGQALAGRTRPSAAVVAHHLCEGASDGSVTDAVPWIVLAMDEARRRIAFEEALALGRRGLEALELSEEDLPAARAQLLTHIALHLQYCGDTVESKRVGDLAVEAARASGDPALFAVAVTARFMWGRAGVPERRADGLFREALERLGDGDPVMRARVLVAWALERGVNEGEGARALPLVREGIELARAADDHDTLRTGLFTEANLAFGTADVATQQAALDELDAIAAALTSAEPGPFAFDIERVRAVTRLQQGDRQSVERAIAASLATAERRGVGRIPETMAAMWRSMLALADGRLDEAAADADQLLGLAATDSNFQNSWASLVFRIAWERGTAGELVALVRPMADEMPDLVALQVVLAQALVAAGERDAAADVFARLSAEGFAAVPRDVVWSASLAWLAELCLEVGDAERAAALHALLLPFSGQVVVVGWGVFAPAAADRCLGMLELQLGRLDDADAHLVAALALEASLGFRALAARTRYWQARVALARGNGDLARRTALEVAAEARSLGLGALAADADELAG